jgi:hypothetical protein
MGRLLCSDVGWDGGPAKILPYISDFGNSLHVVYDVAKPNPV